MKHCDNTCVLNPFCISAPLHVEGFDRRVRLNLTEALKIALSQLFLAHDSVLQYIEASHGNLTWCVSCMFDVKVQTTF